MNSKKMILAILLMAFGFGKASAQDSYTYFKLSDIQTYDSIYLIMSDPIKNWYSLGYDKQNDLKAEFKTSAARQTGEAYIANKYQFIPSNAYPSLSKAREAIQNEVNKFKSDIKGAGKPVKVFYVNFNQY